MAKALPPSLISTTRKTMKEADRQCIERCLQDIDLWRASGMNAQQWQALTVGLPGRKLDCEIGISVT
jgi:hypothetical protein